MLFLAVPASFFLPWADRTYKDGSGTVKTGWELMETGLLDEIGYVVLGCVAGLALVFLVLRGLVPPTRRILVAEIGFAGLIAAGYPELDHSFWVKPIEVKALLGAWIALAVLVLWQIWNLRDVFRAPFEGEDGTGASERVATALVWLWALFGFVAVGARAVEYLRG